MTKSSNFRPTGIITTDLHLSDKREDQDRFKLFDWIIDNYREELSFVFILGDLTDRKNFHADHLVDKVADSVYRLTRHFRVLLLRGNHDYDADPVTPFFGFLGKMVGVTYFRRPTLWRADKYGWPSRILFLPHSRTPGQDWGLSRYKNLDAICMHQTFGGAISETGYRLSGIGTMPFRRFECPIFSGDVHAAQRVGPITYVGSPYHVHFGDQFSPRLLLVDKNFNTQEVHFPAPKKFVFDIPHAVNLLDYEQSIRAGDQAKVRLHLPTSELGNWPAEREKIHRIAKDLKLVLGSVVLKELKRETSGPTSLGPSPKRRDHREIFGEFCQRNKVGKDIIRAGTALLED